MTIVRWKTLDSKTIFEHPRLTLIEDSVVLPDGKAAKYLRYQYTGNVATIIAIDSNDKILVQSEYSYPPAEVLYQFPGGVVPLSEDISEGANRELMEECGLSGELERIGSYYSDNRRSESRTHVFVAKNLKRSSLPADVEEFIEYDWFDESQIDEMVANGQCKHAYILATWMVFKSWRKSAKPRIPYHDK